MTPTAEPPFTLHLLGTPRVEGPGGDVGLPLGKPLAALCYVALEPSAVSRTDLAAVLWPSSPESRAKASIRQALWLIRKHTDAGALVEENGELRIDPAVLGTDLTAFETALENERLKDALALWNGGLLHAFTIPDAQPWLTWAEDVRSRWEGRLGRALEARAARAVGEERVVWLDRALDVRPYRVDTWLELLQARVDLRDVDGAAEALVRLQQVADEDDADQVRDAEERLRLLKRAEFGDPDERLTPEFVGRSREFAALMTAWRSALSGRSRVVGITGPAGIGKSALAAEALRHAEVDDALAVEVRCVRTEVTLDLAVAASMVSDLLRRPGAAGVGEGSIRILRTLVPSKADAVAPPPRAALVADALADLMDAVSHEQPVLLLVDDAHWMDRPSALVLLRAVRQIRTARVLMLWTCRTGGAAARDGGSDAVTALADAASQGSAGLLELRPLGEAEVAEMVTLLLAEEDPERLSRLATRIHLASAGSPLHVVELLRGMQDRGLVGLDDEGRWVLAEDATDQVVPLSESLEDTLAHRIRELTDEARTLGRRLAAEGAPLSPEALGVSGDTADPVTVGALAELLRRGLVGWTRDDRLELAHGEVAEALAPSRGAREGEDDVGSRPRVLLRLAAVLAVLLMVVAAVWLRPSPATVERPYGGGTLWLVRYDALFGFTLHEGENPLRPHDTIATPPGFRIQTRGPRPYEDGWVLGGMSVGNPSRAPDALIATGGRVDTLVAGPGDDVVNGLAPSLGAALVSVQHPDTTRFRRMLVRVDLQPRRDTTVLAAGDISYVPRDWSADGRHLLAVIDTRWDTLAVLDPGGRRIASVAAPHRLVGTTAFCGPERVILSTHPPGELLAYWLWDLRSDTVRPVPTRTTPSDMPACSPDGTAIAYLVSAEQRTVLYLDPLEGGEGRVWDVTDRSPIHVEWTPDPGPVPASLEILGPGEPLARGSRARMVAEVLDPRGHRVEREVVWSSSDPTTVSVTPAGLLTGNRPGVASIRGTVDGWITDSATVRVSDRAPEGRLVFADSFPVLDTTRWIGVGEPTPKPIRYEGQAALHMDGDGRYVDGISSWETFDLTSGGTLEAVFRMEEFRRNDRNRLALCLQEGDLGPEPTNPATWELRQNVCVTWPSGEGFDFDPRALTLSASSGTLGAVPIDTLLQTGRWNRLSLQMRPDGRISAAIGDSVVVVHPTEVRNTPDVRWRILVVGHGLDNQLLLREIVLWREERIPSVERPAAEGTDGGSG